MLCEPCQTEHDKWLEPRQYHLHNMLPSNGPLNVRAMKDAQTAKFERWKRTCLYQTGLIWDHCHKNHQR